MRPREEGHSGQVDHYLAIPTAGLSRAIRQGPVDVVVGDPLNGADGVTPSREKNEPPGAVAGVSAHPGAPQDGPKTCCIWYARYSSYGRALVDYEFRPMDVARSLQPRTRTPSGNRRSIRGHVMLLAGRGTTSCISVCSSSSGDPTQDPLQFLGPVPQPRRLCRPTPSRRPSCCASQEIPTCVPSWVGRGRRIGFGAPLSSQGYGR